MSTTRTHTGSPPDGATGTADGKAAARASARASIRAAKRKRRTSAQNIRSHTHTVARVNGEPVKLDGNPNTAKRHAAKLDNTARLTPRQYSPGTPDGKRHYMPTLETSWARMPALGSHLSKRPLKGTSRG